jgi:hypothetical protein
MNYSSTITAFSSSLLLAAWSGPPSSTFDEPFDPQVPINHDYASDIEKNYLAFLILGKMGVFKCIDCLSVSGSY